MGNMHDYINNCEMIHMYENGLFLNTLYHDSRKGLIFVATIDKNTKDIKTYSDNNPEYISIAAKEIGEKELNTYCSVNTFKNTKNKRDVNNLYNITSFYIDLDVHGKDLQETQDIVLRTQKLLNELINKQEILAPTMVTQTGRGLGLFYVLESSINAKNKKMADAYTFILNFMIRKFKMILKAAEKTTKQKYLSVDTSCKDKARLCRIPGTINQETGALCFLSAYNGRFYRLEQINEVFSAEKLAEITKKDNKPKKTKEEVEENIKKKTENFKNINAVMKLRLDGLKKLQEDRKSVLEGWRESALFVAANCYIQINDFDYKKTEEDLKDFNEGFTKPLKNSEIKACIRGIKAVSYTDKKGQLINGFYKLSNEKIADLLELEPNEMRTYGFSNAKRDIERKEKRQKKQNRNELVLELANSDNDYTYMQISEMTGISLATIKRILKNAGYKRNNKNSKKEEVKAAESVKMATDDFLNQKRLKIDTVYFVKQKELLDKINITVSTGNNNTLGNVIHTIGTVSNNSFILLAKDKKISESIYSNSILAELDVEKELAEDMKKWVKEMPWVLVQDEIWRILCKLNKICPNSRAKECISGIMTDIYTIKDVYTLTKIKDKIETLCSKMMFDFDYSAFYRVINDIADWLVLIEAIDTTFITRKNEQSEDKKIPSIDTFKNPYIQKAIKKKQRKYAAEVTKMINNEIEKVRQYYCFTDDAIETFKKYLNQIRAWNRTEYFEYLGYWNGSLDKQRVSVKLVKRAIESCDYKVFASAIRELADGHFYFGFTGTLQAIMKCIPFNMAVCG